MALQHVLPFEKDIHAMEELLARLEAKQGDDASAASVTSDDEIRRSRRARASLTRKTYSSRAAWDTVQVSRHPARPQTNDYIQMIFTDFVELHGDRAIGDDRAIRTGFARIG